MPFVLAPNARRRLQLALALGFAVSPSLAGCHKAATSPPAATLPVPTAALGYEGTLFARALDVSCAPPGAQAGALGCIALVRYLGEMKGAALPPSADRYGNIAFVRTDAAGAVTWAKVLMAGFDPISLEHGAFVDDDLRVRLLSTGEFLVSGTYEGRVYIGAGDNNQELGPSHDRSLFTIEFHADGTFDNWEDTGNDLEQHALAAIELPSTDLVIAGTCQGDVPLDSGSFPCGPGTSGYLLTVHYDCSTVGGVAFGGERPAEASDLATDAAGNLYVSGSFEERMTFGAGPDDLAAGEDDAFVTKIGPDGQRAWTVTAGSLGHDRGGRLAKVSGGILWTALVAQGARVGQEIFAEAGQVVALIDETGRVLWAKQVASARGSAPLHLAAAPDASFALFGAAYLGRFKADGTLLWERTDADVSGGAFTADSLVVSANVLGAEALGASIAPSSDDVLRGALVWIPR